MTWRVSAALEEAYRPNPGAFRLFVDTPSVIATLRAANCKPLNVRDIVERFFGHIPEEPEYSKLRARVRNCLDYLKVREAVAPVKVPGRSGVSWKLTSLSDNISIRATMPKDKGRPEAAIADREREKIVAILIKARQALGTNEITRRHLAINGEEPTGERIERGVGLVRRWLAQLRSQGIIRSIKPSTGYGLKWEAVNWTDEIAATAAQNRSAAGSPKQPLPDQRRRSSPNRRHVNVRRD